MWGWLFKRPDPRATLLRDLPRLREEFFAAASASGKPRGLRWKSLDWGEAMELVREKATGHLVALMAVTIAFEAIEGGEMEGVEAVGNLRTASAVFFLHAGHWRTTGKTLFNLEPPDAVARFAHLYERVEKPS